MSENARLRVALVVSGFPKLSETFIVNQFIGLLKRGWDVQIVCSQSQKETWANFAHVFQGQSVHSRVHVGWPCRPKWLAAILMPLAVVYCLLGSPAATWRYISRGWGRFGIGVLVKLYIDLHLIRLNPDVVHFEFGALAANRMYLKSMLKCRVVVSFRGYDLNYAGLQSPSYYQEVWENADAIHFLGTALECRAVERGCPIDKPRALIPPAVDTTFFDPGIRGPYGIVGTIERPLHLLSVGRLEWEKGYEYLLAAVRLLRAEGICCEYRIVGDGEYVEAIAFACYQLGLEDTVQILSARPHNEIPALMLWADVLVHGAVSEGFCNAVLEAQAMGLPVVCSDAGGLSENVTDGETGFVVPRRDPEAIAHQVALLARDPLLRQKMGAAGRTRVLERFQIPGQIEAFEKLYKQVLQSDDTNRVGKANGAGS